MMFFFFVVVVVVLSASRLYMCLSRTLVWKAHESLLAGPSPLRVVLFSKSTLVEIS